MTRDFGNKEKSVSLGFCPDTNPDDLLGNALTDMVFEKVVEG